MALSLVVSVGNHGDGGDGGDGSKGGGDHLGGVGIIGLGGNQVSERLIATPSPGCVDKPVFWGSLNSDVNNCWDGSVFIFHSHFVLQEVITGNTGFLVVSFGLDSSMVA